MNMNLSEEFIINLSDVLFLEITRHNSIWMKEELLIFRAPRMEPIRQRHFGTEYV
jgi:hypothetical protein